MAAKSKSGRKAHGGTSKSGATESDTSTVHGIDDEVPNPLMDAKQMSFDLCVQTLMSGCVSSFVEFYNLSHRDPVCVDALANKMFSIGMDKLPYIQSTLVQAEKARRGGEFREVYDCYIKLANYFEDEMDHKTSLHFHQVGLDNAKQSSDKELEGIAHENFGNAHERLGNTEMAIKFHETHLRLSEAAWNQNMKRQANKNLIRVYMKRAAECEAAAEYPRAKELYEKSMNTARANSDTAAEGEAYHKLGNITVLLGDLDKALEYQKRFLLVSKEMRSDTNEGKAQISLAELQEELGQVTDALSSLQRSLQIAEEKDDHEAICEACCKLGMLHNKSGNYTKAVQYLEQNYEVMKKIGDKAEVERARILVGVARGNQFWTSGFLQMVDRDINSIMKWKCQGVMPDHGQ